MDFLRSWRWKRKLDGTRAFFRLICTVWQVSVFFALFFPVQDTPWEPLHSLSPCFLIPSNPSNSTFLVINLQFSSLRFLIYPTIFLLLFSIYCTRPVLLSSSSLNSHQPPANPYPTTHCLIPRPSPINYIPSLPPFVSLPLPLNPHSRPPFMYFPQPLPSLSPRHVLGCLDVLLILHPPIIKFLLSGLHPGSH
jgi:hypothetical protein